MTPRRYPSDERGQVTAFVVGLAGALLLLTGLVVDGGRAISARLQALDDAQQAARVGAEMLSPNSLRGGGSVLDPTAATAAAQAFLAAAGTSGHVSITGTQVHVTVTTTVQTPILGIVNVHALTVSESGSAQAERGAESPG